MTQSIRRISFHGLSLEMANLTVKQPSIRVLKAEIHNGLQVERSENKPIDNYKVIKSSFFGTPMT